MRNKPDKKYQKGYTLVEVIIVVVILAILTGIAISGFLKTADKYRVESETKEMFSNLMDARAKALQRSRVFFVRLYDDGYETYEDIVPAPNGDGVLNAAINGGDRLVAIRSSGPRGGRNITPEEVFKNKVVRALAGGVQEFRFDRSGVASVDGLGYIRIVSNSRRDAKANRPDYDCIVIGPTRVKLGQFNANGGGICEEK